jgi:hypothetical protein
MQEGHQKADGVRHKFGVIAERPTGAGLTLGMGLRAIGGKAGLMRQRRRSPAKPDGLGGVVSILTGEEGILGERREFACAEVLAGVLFDVFIAITMNRQFSCTE